MIEIKCVDDRILKDFVQRTGVPCDRVYVMTDRDEVLGEVAVVASGEEVELVYMTAPDVALMDALLRAVLNAERAMGAKCAKMSCLSAEEHVCKKRYDLDDETKTLKIADFFAKSACKQ